MAAATEWLNALAAGSTVISVRRREPERRPLQAERQLFSRRGLASFHAADATARAAVLRRLATPSYPPGRAWDLPVERARAEGRFRVAAASNGAPQVICATGFKRGFAHDRLLRRLVEEQRLETYEQWLVLAADSTVPGADGRRADAGRRGRPRRLGVPGGRHARGREVRGARVPAEGEGVSYTLRGRIDSRLAAALAPALAAAALAVVLHRWWPLELAGLMLAVGVALDIAVYDRVLDYQPGWLALPLGAVELGAVTALAYALRLGAPLDAAIGFFAGAWLLRAGLRPRRLSPAPALLRRGRRRARPSRHLRGRRARRALPRRRRRRLGHEAADRDPAARASTRGRSCSTASRRSSARTAPSSAAGS